MPDEKMKKSQDKQTSLGIIIRRNFVRGLAALIPLYLTFLMVQFLIHSLTRPLTPAARWVTQFLGFDINPQITEIIVIATSFIITLTAIVFVGLIAQRVVGRRIVGLYERILDKLPVVRTIYKAFREFTRILTGDAVSAYRKVVYVNLPGNSGRVLGFITGSLDPGDGTTYHTVFIPTTPNISTGFLLLMKPDEFYETSLTPDEGLRVILSVGILSNRNGDGSSNLHRFSDDEEKSKP